MARFNRGWFKIDRELADGDIAERGNFTLGLFVRILYMANWKDGNSLLGGQRVKIRAGQLATGLRELSPDLLEDPHMNKVRSALRYLETRGTIAQAINNHGRIITVCNWAEYQRAEDDPHKQSTDDAQTGHKRPTNGPQHSEEGKKERREISENLTPESLGEATLTWGRTLARLGIDKPPEFDRDQIARLIQRYGFEKTNMALLGAGFEEKGGDFDPSNHVNIRRLTDKPAIFDKFVNLGAKNKPTEEKVTPWKVKL